MPTYAMLGNYTEQGIRNIRQAPARVNAARTSAKRFKGKLKQFYLALGAIDTLVILDFPDDAAAAQFAMATGALGNIRTTTVRLFDEPEFKKIVAGVAKR